MTYMMPATMGGLMATKGTIDRRSALPFYVQLKALLTEQIESGQLQPGDQIPSEPELCRRYGVSRTVVRQALKEMTYEGMLLREKGVGTFVAEPKISSTSLVHSLTGFAQDMASRGLKTINKVLEQSIVPASQKLAAMLDIEELEPVIKIDRLRYVQDEPIVLVTSFLPYALCRPLITADLTERSLYDCLEEDYGLRIARGRRLIDAVAANEYQSDLLMVEKGAPLIRVESVSFLDDGRAIEYFAALFRADRSRFEVELAQYEGQGSFGRSMGLSISELFLES